MEQLRPGSNVKHRNNRWILVSLSVLSKNAALFGLKQWSHQCYSKGWRSHLLGATQRSWCALATATRATERRCWWRCCQSQSEDVLRPSWWPGCRRRIHLQRRILSAQSTQCESVCVCVYVCVCVWETSLEGLQAEEIFSLLGCNRGYEHKSDSWWTIIELSLVEKYSRYYYDGKNVYWPTVFTF